MSGPLLALAPLRAEAAAVRRGAPGAAVLRTGTGPARAAAAAASARRAAGRRAPAAVAVMGIAGGLHPDLRTGDVVVADRVLHPDGSVAAELASPALLAASLRAAGLRTVIGPVVSTERVVVSAAARRRLAATGAVAVDTESAPLISPPGWDVPAVVVRVVADPAGRPLLTPGTARAVLGALAVLCKAAPVVQRWAGAASPRSVVLAEPRSFCAGVERAVETVTRAIDRFGAPLYVRRHIVHNEHVVADLQQRGAVFVRELSDVPDGATVVFSAHGVAPAVRDEAARRDLRVLDATCPLVAKVHSEVRRFLGRGHQVVLIGHPGHDETEGTLGESPEIRLVETPDQVATLDLDPTRPVAYTTQTTLAPDETEATVAALRDRYGELLGPPASDICYATHNRQAAVRAIARQADVVIVVGSPTSSNSHRLVEVASREGTPAYLVHDEGDLDPGWLAGTRTIGVTAGASTPESVVERVVDALAGLGPLELHAVTVRKETVTFSLPQEVR
jgi:4-hydroxy-3-methylbut-2-enyl diphosphate reductase